MPWVGDKTKGRWARIAIFLPNGEAAHIAQPDIDVGAQFIQIESLHQILGNGGGAIEQKTIIFGENQKVIADKNGLQLKSPLGEETYTNPLNGKFTTEDWAKSLQFAEELPFSDIAKNTLYKHLILIPKCFSC